MGDLVFVPVVIAFFALMVGLVAVFDRVIGPDAASDLAVGGDDVTQDDISERAA